MFSNLTNKQCALLVAVLAGLFGLPLLLLALNVLEALLGGLQFGLLSFSLFAYMGYRVWREVFSESEEV